MGTPSETRYNSKEVNPFREYNHLTKEDLSLKTQTFRQEDQGLIVEKDVIDREHQQNHLHKIFRGVSHVNARVVIRIRLLAKKLRN